MWVGAANRLWLVKSGRLELQTNVVPTRPILSLAQDRTGALWVGTEGDGLYQIRAGQVKCFTQADGLGSDQVRALHLDAADNLWIGTTGGGLSRLTAGRIVTLTTSRGLPADTIAQILEDDAGYLWLGTYRGIARVSKSQFEDVVSGRTQSLSPRVLGLSDGMPSEECTGGYSPAGLKLSSGELCFATLKGIVMVDPPRAWPITPPPPVRLEELLIDGVAQNPSSSPQAPNGHKLEPLDANRSPSSASSSADRQLLFVAPGRHQFEFHYTGLNFGAPERIRFRYQLEGLDPGWVEAGTRRTAFYTDVPPGNYRFQVIACNNDGVWSQTGAAIGLEIQPFLWQRWWFIAVAGLAALALAAGLSRLFERRRHQRELTRLAALHVVERERTRIAKDIHDDLGATLSAIRLLSKFAQAPEMPAERLREDMRQIAAKALESTQALDEIVWAVDPQSDSLEGFVNYACAFATEQLALADVRCRLDLPANIPAKTLQADVRHNLFLAFKEVITNVLKHAAATEVHVSMEINPQALAIAVTDNGRGLPADDSRMASGAGLATRRHGLPNLRSRLRQIGGDCEMESLPGRGVTARLRIPL
jgi:signal transduction histidine kinase